MTRLLRFLLIGFLLLVTAPAVQAQLYQVPGQNPATSKEQVDLYQTPNDKTTGTVSIPDGKLSVLMQPEGREWREFRTHWLRIVAGVMTLGVIALLILFYLYRGTIRIHGGRSGRLVKRFDWVDRFVHWATAVSFIIMALTGLVVTFGRPVLIPLIGHQAFTSVADASKYLHNFFSVPFVIGLVLIFVSWIRDNIPERADLVWLKTMGGILSKQGEHPEAGRFNAGQKGIFWAVVLGGLTLAVSGFLLMMPFAVTGIGGMQILHVVHGVVASIMIAIIIAHIYIGTVGMEGAFDAMGTGRVDENWAKDHHRRWYEEELRKQHANDGRGAIHRAAE
ncbi:formate dehydrogenase subunit gamma [Azospirillum sp. sgz302134]